MPGFLEPRIEATTRVASILISWAAYRSQGIASRAALLSRSHGGSLGWLERLLAKPVNHDNQRWHMSLRALCRPPPATAIDGSDFACLPALVRGSRSTGPVVELWEIERPCTLLAAPREDLEFRREPLIEAIESAFLHENEARAVLQLVGEHPGTAVGTEDAIEPLARTCFSIWTVGEALGVSA